MALDPNIILGIRTPQIQQQDPLDTYTKVLGLKSAIAQGGMQDLQMQQTRQGIEADQRIRQLLGTNPKASAEEIMAIDPKTGMQYAKNRAEIARSDAAAGKDRALGAKAELEAQVKRLEHGAALLGTATDQASWDAALNVGASQGIFDEKAMQAIPREFNPQTQKALINGGMTRAQQLAQEHQQAVLAESMRHNRATETGTARGQDITMRGQDITLRGQDLTATAPRYEQSDAGLVALPGRLAPGQTAVATPVLRSDGSPLGKPLKDIPANVNTQIIENSQNLDRARNALALLEGKNVGSAKGDPDATGIKGFLPNQVLNRIDPAGVDTRAAIADLGSLIIHQRSGAAVTAAEFPRLAPFIPNEKDTPETAKKKLRRFVEIYEQESRALSDTYSRDTGYRNPHASRGANTAAQEQNAPPKLGERRYGYVYKGGDPSNQNSWEKVR